MGPNTSNQTRSGQILPPVRWETELSQLRTQACHELTFTLDKHGRFVNVGPAFEQLLGFASGALVGQPLLDCLHAEDALRLREHWADLADIHTPLSFRHRTADGRWRWLEAETMACQRDGDEFIVGLAHDVTERKQLHVEQHMFTALVENSADLIKIATLQGEVVFMNNAGQRILGLESGDDVLGQPFTRFVDAGDVPQLVTQILPYVLKVGGWIGELNLRHTRTSTIIPMLANIFLLLDPETGEPSRLASVMRDIRERKREEERHHLLADASALLGSSLELAKTASQLPRMATANFAHWCALDLFGDASEAPLLEVSHADHAKDAPLRSMFESWPENRQHSWARLIQNDETLFLPDLAVAPRIQGEEWASLRELSGESLIAVPLRVHNRTLGVLAFASEPGCHYTPEDLMLADELANRAALALENARLYHNARAALGIRDEFLSIASHELKTPLTSVLGSLQLLQRRTHRQQLLPEREQQTMNTIIQQAQRLNRLIDNLLDISRLQRGQFTLEQQDCDISEIARQVNAEMQPITNHALQVEAPEQPLVVRGDSLRLYQVLQNLIQNAIKYSPSESTILTRIERRHRDLVISVIDNGMGIPSEALPRLFDRFYRAADSSTLNTSGLGIGLFVVREIVGLHGGSVAVASKPGSGSTFTVTLPLHEAENEVSA